jgi:hypothetical protein
MRPASTRGVPRPCHERQVAVSGITVGTNLALLGAPMTAREEFHRFIDELGDDIAKPGLHAAVDELDDVWISPALSRMQALRARLTDESR